MKILYYKSQKNLKNKAQTGLVTFDYFKKHFLMPIDFDKFDLLLFEEDADFLPMPQLQTIIYINMDFPDEGRGVKSQGRIEKIIREITSDDEIIHVLLQEIKPTANGSL